MLYPACLKYLHFKSTKTSKNAISQFHADTQQVMKQSEKGISPEQIRMNELIFIGSLTSCRIDFATELIYFSTTLLNDLKQCKGTSTSTSPSGKQIAGKP